MSDLRDLTDAVMRLEQQLGDLTGRVDRMIVRGRVVKSEHGKGVRIQLTPDDDGDEPELSPPLPYADASGASSYRPQVGEQVVALAPHGDLRQATVISHGHSEDKPNPAADEKETVHYNRDGVRISSRDGVVTIKAKKIALETEGGSLTIDKSGNVFKGDKVRHDDKNIGKDHVHAGVQKGAAKTEAPEA